MRAMTVDEAKRIVELNDQLTELRNLAQRVGAASVPASCELKAEYVQGMRLPRPSLSFKHLVDEWRDLVAREAAAQIASIEVELSGLGVSSPAV